MSALKLLKLSKTLVICCGIIRTICLIFLFTSDVAGQIEDSTSKTINNNVTYRFYMSFNDIMTSLKEELNNDPKNVSNVLREFHTHYPNVKLKNITTKKRKAFIVFEGSNITGVKLIAKTVAKEMGALVLSYPPYKLRTLRKLGGELKNLVFHLGSYAISNKAKYLLNGGHPVIATGYWTKIAVINIRRRRRMNAMVPESLYNPPPEMLAPDLLFYITDPHENNQTELFQKETTITKIYKRFQQVPVIFTYMNRDMFPFIRRIIKSRLGLTRDLRRGRHLYSEEYVTTDVNATIPSSPPIPEKHETLSDVIKRLNSLKLEEERRLVDFIMHTFNQEYPKPTSNVTDGKRKPFIVIEAEDQATAVKIAKMLADSMGGEFITLPPTMLKDLLPILPKTSTLLNLFHSLCVYAVSNKATELLNKGIPVIATGYWTIRSSYAIQKFKTLPLDSPLYTFPDDLLAPDLTVYMYLQFDTTPRYEIYKSFKKINVETVSMSKGFRDVFEKVSKLIINKLGKIRDLGNFENQSQITASNTPSDLGAISNKRGGLLFRRFNDVQHCLFTQQNNPDIRQLMKAFNTFYPNYGPVTIQNKIRKPFIVVEGRNRELTKATAEILAKHMDARLVNFPPDKLSPFLKMFQPNETTELFDALCLYALSNQVAFLINSGEAVVTTGYWIREVLKELKHLDTIGVTGYDRKYFPSDLLAPDLTFYMVYNKMLDIGGTDSNVEKYLKICQRVQRNFVKTVYCNNKVENSIDFMLRVISRKINSTRALNLKFIKANATSRIFNRRFKPFKSLSEVLTALDFDKLTKPETKREILEIFYSRLRKTEVSNVKKGERKPFIVFEGINKTLTSMLTAATADCMGTTPMVVQPYYLKRYMLDFKESRKLRSIIDFLVIYIISSQAKERLKAGMPVVVHRYWINKVAYKIKRFHDPPPPENDPMYNSPDDLFIPDITFFIASRLFEKDRQNTTGENVIARSVEICTKFRKHNVHVLKSTDGFEEIMFQVKNAIRNLQFTRNVSAVL